MYEPDVALLLGEEETNGIGPNAGGDPKYLGVGLRHLF